MKREGRRSEEGGEWNKDNIERIPLINQQLQSNKNQQVSLALSPSFYMQFRISGGFLLRQSVSINKSFSNISCFAYRILFFIHFILFLLHDFSV